MLSSDDPEPATPARSQLPPLRLAADLLGESTEHRLELAALEMAEASEHAAASLVLGMATVLLSLITGFSVTLLAASLVWDSPHRVWWLVGLGLIYLGGTAACGLALRSRLRNWHPLVETRWQLQQDIQCLSSLIKSFGP